MFSWSSSYISWRKYTWENININEGKHSKNLGWFICLFVFYHGFLTRALENVLMRFVSSSYKTLDPYMWQSFCSWSIEPFTQDFCQKAAYFPNDGWTFKCPIFSSTLSLKKCEWILWWLVDSKLYRAEGRKYYKVTFLNSLKNVRQGKYKSQSNYFWCNSGPCWRTTLSSLSTLRV